MPSTFISIDYDPEPTLLARQFYSLAGDVRVRSLREPLRRAIREVIGPAFRENFAVGGRPRAWAPLAESTVRNKGHATPLIDSGTLQRIAGQLNLWTIDGVKGEARAENLGKAFYGLLHQVGAK